MPVSVSFTSTQSYQIPDQVYNMRVRMWGGGGGGEYVSPNLLSNADGANGGDSSWLGMVAGGGQGGGVSGNKNSLGSGGGFNTNGFAGVSASSGNNGALFAGGSAISYGGVSYGAGGDGTPGYYQYVSTSTHFFNNDTNQHIFSTASPDITVSFENKDAADGLFGYAPTNGKYYDVRFVVPYTDNSWTWYVTDICQQAAGGGTAAPYTLNGFRDKYNGGIKLWFQNNKGANGYIRCFTFVSIGTKQGAQGRGGGSGGALEVTLSRNQIIEKGYTPGASYTATVGGAGAAGGNNANAGTSGRIELFMYIIPTVNLSSTKTAVIRGGCAQLAWNTTGDADLITWTSGPLTNSNLSSNATVCPTQTTTYTAVASGSGGSSPPASVTIVVYEPPTASISSPTSLVYGQQGFISFETQYANSSITITPYYTFRDNTTGNNYTTTGTVINITPVANSAEIGGLNTVVSNNSLATNIPYGESGPFSVQYIIVAQGSGGEATDTTTTEIIIDDTPDNLVIEETDGRFKSENPVFTPQTDVLSELMYIDGVDIPVEIKSNAPIQVDINKQNDWKNLRSL